MTRDDDDDATTASSSAPLTRTVKLRRPPSTSSSSDEASPEDFLQRSGGLLLDGKASSTASITGKSSGRNSRRKEGAAGSACRDSAAADAAVHAQRPGRLLASDPTSNTVTASTSTNSTAKSSASSVSSSNRSKAGAGSACSDVTSAGPAASVSMASIGTNNTCAFPSSLLPESSEDVANKRARLDDSSVSASASTSQQPRPCVSPYDHAKNSLMWIPGLREDEVIAALNKQRPPYGLQMAMNAIHAARNRAENYRASGGIDGGDGEDSRKRFSPYVGMKIRKPVSGEQYQGEVTSAGEMMITEDGTSVRMWEVTYQDGTVDDMDWYELLQARADRPTRTNPCRGRQLRCLELFSGCGLISQEFAERKWQVRSVDNSPHSHASDKVDVMTFELHHIGFVPDFIWASPPCFTYSIMAGGKHRGSANPHEFEKTTEARQHNHIFARMVKLLHQARTLNPHLIVVIENPVGLMYKMPLMKELEDNMGLHKTTIDYCAFGRCDKKPTHLWTNDFGLHATLSEFRCSSKCPYNEGVHPVSARSQGHIFNAAAIPDALAEEVAEYVNAKFVLDRIRHTKEAEVPAG